MSNTPFWPAEWAPQDGVLIAWPHAGTDWAGNLADVEHTYTRLLAAIAGRQTAIVCVPDAALAQRVVAIARTAGVAPQRLRLVTLPYDDTWLRDSGPLTLIDGDRHQLLDFRFTGWGGKFDANQDDRIVANLVELGLFRPGSVHHHLPFVLEGGAVETDGEGSLLSTWHCLATRHPQRSREQIEATLTQTLKVDRFLWLENGALAGDDTDAHIDTLARFVSPQAIAYQACDDRGDGHYPALSAMAAELAQLRTRDGQPYQLHALPWPKPVHDADGRRLAASYANFLVINGAVLMPGYDDADSPCPATDAAAAEVLARAFPGRQVEIIPCRPLIEQNGSLHCITMQLPEGVLADV